MVRYLSEDANQDSRYYENVWKRTHKGNAISSNAKYREKRAAAIREARAERAGESSKMMIESDSICWKCRGLCCEVIEEGEYAYTCGEDMGERNFGSPWGCSGFIERDEDERE